MWFDANHQAAAFENPARSQVAGKVGDLLPPAGPDGQIRSSTWAWSLAINAPSKNKDAAWRFLPGYEQRNASANRPLMKKSIQRASPYGKIPKLWRPLTGTVANIVVQPNCPLEACQDPVDALDLCHSGRSRWAAALQEIYEGNRTAEQALKRAAKNMNQMGRK